MTVGVIVILFFVMPGMAEATLVGTKVGSQLGAFSGQSGAGFARPEDPRVVVANVIGYALGFLGVLALGYTVYAGFIIMTSGGNQDKVDQGKTMIKNGVIGVGLILSAFAITQFIAAGLKGAGKAPLRGLDADFSTEGSREFRFCDQPNPPPGLNCPGRQNQ